MFFHESLSGALDECPGPSFLRAATTNLTRGTYAGLVGYVRVGLITHTVIGVTAIGQHVSVSYRRIRLERSYSGTDGDLSPAVVRAKP